MLKDIGIKVVEILVMLGDKIYLELWVKVQKDGRETRKTI